MGWLLLHYCINIYRKISCVGVVTSLKSLNFSYSGLAEVRRNAGYIFLPHLQRLIGQVCGGRERGMMGGEGEVHLFEEGNGRNRKRRLNREEKTKDMDIQKRRWEKRNGRVSLYEKGNAR